MMEQINRVRPEASVMKILHPMTGHNVEVSEDTGMVAEKENIISLQRRQMGKGLVFTEVPIQTASDCEGLRADQSRELLREN